MFYGPTIFKTLGLDDVSSFYAAIITEVVNVIATIVSIYLVDKVGRRLLLLAAGVQMFLSHVVIAIILKI